MRFVLKRRGTGKPHMCKDGLVHSTNKLITDTYDIRKLAEALKIENPDISSTDTNHQYSLFLLEQARLLLRLCVLSE